MKENEKFDQHSGEIRQLLEAIRERYGYDFYDYSAKHLERRIIKAVEQFKCQSIGDLTFQIRYRDGFFDSLLNYISVYVTEMFRDPSFYLLLREEIFPQLAHKPELKIWNAGCATGEEVYSVAILLHELGLYDRSQIFATDYNQQILDKAESGQYSKVLLHQYADNYLNAGGKKLLSDYYSVRDSKATMDPALRANIVFSTHNLVSDPGFEQMDMIICRNVMIYFNRQLQNRVIGLFADNLAPKGFLCVGAKESIMFTEAGLQFSAYNPKLRIYQR